MLKHCVAPSALNASRVHCALPAFRGKAIRGHRCCRTAAFNTAPSGTGSNASLIREPLPVLSRISACVEVDDLVATYETFAGRSAMIGFLVAALVELVTDQGIFYSFTAQDASNFSTIALLCVVSAAALAYGSKQRFGAKFKEAVISSMTAARRSASSVSQRRVDRAVDQLFEKAFNFGVLYSLLDEELL